jgi:hypothetical protein
MNAMKPARVAATLLCLTSIAQANCPEKRSRALTFVDLVIPDGAPRPADANAFSVVNDDMTIEKLFATVGPPDASDGTTSTIFIYCFADGSEVRVATRDGSTIDSVRHDRKELYKRKKKK